MFCLEDCPPSDYDWMMACSCTLDRRIPSGPTARRFGGRARSRAWSSDREQLTLVTTCSSCSAASPFSSGSFEHG